jgi:CheY-like chemotaxis protein
METEPMHILLADDDEADRLLFIDAFAELAVKNEVSTVKTGIELMEWLNNGTNSLPHLIFLDLNMPGKSGLDCLQEIRNTERLKNILIAIYSTSNSEKDVEDTFFYGANVYITKPADFHVLRQTLQKVVANSYIYKDKRLNRENFMLRI